MPILKIKIDEEYLEFKIIPINKKILTSIFLRLKVDRLGFLAHTIKSPKMTREEWGELPSSIITRLIRSIKYYAETIEEKEQELRNISVNIRVLNDEIDDLYQYLPNDNDEWVWEEIKRKQSTIDVFSTQKKELQNSLESLKNDKVVFEEGKEVNYDVQPIQLENS